MVVAVLETSGWGTFFAKTRREDHTCRTGSVSDCRTAGCFCWRVYRPSRWGIIVPSKIPCHPSGLRHLPAALPHAPNNRRVKRLAEACQSLLGCLVSAWLTNTCNPPSAKWSNLKPAALKVPFLWDLGAGRAGVCPGLDRMSTMQAPSVAQSRAVILGAEGRPFGTFSRPDDPNASLDAAVRHVKTQLNAKKVRYEGSARVRPLAENPAHKLTPKSRFSIKRIVSQCTLLPS